MPIFIKTKTYVTHLSISAMEDEGQEIGDGGREVERSYGNSQRDWLLSCLTQRQREYAELLLQGYKRIEIAEKKGVSLMAVHRIVLRIRQRLREKGQVKR